MFNIDFEVPDILGAYQEELKRAPQTIRIFIDKTIRGDIEARVANEIAPYPGPVVYAGPPGADGQSTYRWANEGSRKAFFAKMNALGLEPPYQRTNNLQNSWFVVIDLQGVKIGIGNDAKDPFGDSYSEFVVGSDIQPGHTDTGWEDQTDPILNILIDALNQIEEAWFDIISFEGLA